MMLRSAFLSMRRFSSAAQPSNLLQRFNPSKSWQARGYARSAGHGNGGAKGSGNGGAKGNGSGGARGYGNGGRRGLEVQEGTSSTSSSRSLMMFGIPAALLGVAGVASYVRYNDERRAVQKGKGAKEGIHVKGPTIGGPFTLVNTKGQIVTEKDLIGNWVLLYFGYISSPDIGPSEVQKMSKAIETLESQQNVKLLPIFVTIDPQRDSPSQLDAYLGEFDSRIVGLTGPVYSIRQMAQEYRVFFKRVDEDGNDYLIETSHNMYLISPNMEIVRCIGTEYGAEELVDVISKEVKRSAQ